MWRCEKEVSHRLTEFPLRSKLQRAVMHNIVAFASLHSNHVERLWPIFASVASSTTGGITRSGFSTLLHAWGMNCPYAIENLFVTINASRTGSISYCEWLTAALPQEWYDLQDFQRAFNSLSMGRRPYICATDFARLLPRVFNTAELDYAIRCHLSSSS